MEASVTFKLPEEQDEYDCFMMGRSAMLLLNEFDRWTRQREKYDQTEVKGLDEIGVIREKFYALLNAHRVELG